MSFDFDLNNYSIPDIESFFGLQSDYSLSEVLGRKRIMADIIGNCEDYGDKQKENLILFVNAANRRLIDFINSQSKQGLDDNDATLKPIVNQTDTVYSGFVQEKQTTSLNNGATTIKPTEYLNPIETFPTNISRGVLNNLKRKTIQQTIILNSLYREDYLTTSASDFSLILPNPFKNVLSVCLSSIQLPFQTIHRISAQLQNNSVYIYEIGTNIEGTVVLSDGNYNADAFVDLLQTSINNQLGTDARFVVVYNENTGRITVSNKTYRFDMRFLTDDFIANTSKNKYQQVSYTEPKHVKCAPVTEVYKRLGWIMGFRMAEYRDADSYTTEGLYNGASPDYVYFILNDFNNSQSQNIIGMFSKSVIGNNILAMIPIASPSVNLSNCCDLIQKKREYFGPVNIKRIKIQLLNQYGDIINLNNMDFSFSLDLEVGYDW